MIIPQSHLLPDLIDNALWIVIDPWDKQPTLYNGEKPEPFVDFYNNEACLKIAHYLQDVTHKVIKLQPQYNAHNSFVGYNRINTYDMLQAYMQYNMLTKIVYCGFHYGICIHNTNIGIKAMHNKYECFLKHDLSFVYPGNTANIYAEADLTTKQHGVIIV